MTDSYVTVSTVDLEYGGYRWRVELRRGTEWGERVWRMGRDNVWEGHRPLIRDGIVSRSTVWRVRQRARQMQGVACR